MRSGIFIPVSPIPGTEEAPINIEYVDGKKNTRGIATWHLVNIISKAAFVLQIFFSPIKLLKLGSRFCHSVRCLWKILHSS